MMNLSNKPKFLNFSPRLLIPGGGETPPLPPPEGSSSYLAPSPVWQLSTTLILSWSTCMAAAHHCMQSRAEDGGDGLALIKPAAAFCKLVRGSILKRRRAAAAPTGRP